MVSRRLRRTLVAIVYALVAILGVTAASVAALKATNPHPVKSFKWKRFPDMPGARGEAAAAMVGHDLVVAGGMFGVGRTTAAVTMYEMDKGQWFLAPPLPHPRHHAAGASDGRYAYICGGATNAENWTPTDTLWRELPGQRWQTLAPMPEGRQGHAMVALAGRLYVVGGVGRTNKTLIYDIAANTWTTGAAIPIGRNHLRAVAWNGKVWAIGGRNGKLMSRVDVYDPKTDAWTDGPPLPEPMSAMAVAVSEDSLHVIGGEQPSVFNGRVQDEHDVLDAGSTRWTTSTREILPVHGAAFGDDGGQIVVAGGAARQGALSVLSWTNVTQILAPTGFLSERFR